MGSSDSHPQHVAPSILRSGGLSGIVDIRGGESLPLLLGWLCFFFLLASYAVLRPVRDQIGVAGGSTTIFWLAWCTLAAMLFGNPALAWLVARIPPRRSVHLALRFFALHLLVFYVLQRYSVTAEWKYVGWVFFVWLNVFNLFVVTLFWSLMVDTFRSEQGVRLFPLLAFGGTAGAVLGSFVTATLVQLIGTVNLFLVAMALLECSAQCASWLTRTTPAANRDVSQPVSQNDQPLGGSAWSGIAHLLASPFLWALAAYMVLFNTGSAWLYYQQADFVRTAYPGTDERTAFLAQLDFATNSLALAAELLLAARLMKRLGVTAALAILPALSIVGFLWLGFTPTLAALAVFHVLRRAGEFAIAKPARETLFTLLSRVDKYKAKPIIDTFFHRAGDQVGGVLFLIGEKLSVPTGIAAFLLAAVSAAWWQLSLWLGRARKTASLSPDALG
jgi:ATP:ADP antiporter, AAA family